MWWPFIPVGLLLGCSFGRLKWWHILLAGLALSLSIEILQFTLLRGFVEFEDLFHNTPGCLVGSEVYRVVERMMRVAKSPNKRARF